MRLGRRNVPHLLEKDHLWVQLLMSSGLLPCISQIREIGVVPRYMILKLNNYSLFVCLPFKILTGCTRTIDAFASSAENAAFTTNTYTITGTCFFSAPVAGYYNICFHARFKNSGNSNDVTIAAGSQQYAAAFGDADTRDWRSTGTCFIYVIGPTNMN